jgi:hypothetical protein
MDWALPVGLAVGLGVLLRRSVKPPATITTGATGLTQAATDVTPRAVQAQANVIESTAPVTHALESLGSPTISRVGRNMMVNDFNPQSNAVRQLHAFTEGVMDSTRLSEAPRVLIKDSTLLSPVQRTRFEHLRLIENEIGNLQTGGKTTLHANPVTGTPWGANVIGDLQREAASLRTDPGVARIADRQQNLIRSIWQHPFDQGLISASELGRMQGRTGFAPLVSAEGKPGMIDRLIRLTGTQEQKSDLLRLATLLKQEGAGANARFLPSAQATEAMVRTLMNTAAHNRARVFALDHIAAAPRGTPYHGVVSVVPKTGDDTLTVMRSGVETHYAVRDSALRTALTIVPDAPDVVTGILGRMRQGYQAYATGVGNPAFAVPAALYNGAIAAIVRPAGTKVGLFGGDIIGGMAESMVGAARGIHAVTARTLATVLQDSIRANGFLAQTMTPNMAQHFANKLAATWQRSTVHSMQEYGAVGVGRLSADTHIPNQYTLMQATNPEYVSRVPRLREAYNRYRDVLDMIKSGANIQFFARNRGRLGDATAARMASELVGNPSTRGSGQIARKAIGSMPYANVATQEFAAIGRSARENPTMFAARLAIGVGIPAMAVVEAGRQLPDGEREDFFDYLYRRMTPNDAARMMVLPMPGMLPEDMPHIALPNSIRVAWAMARDGYAMLAGVTPDATTERMYANMGAGVASAQPITAPPILNTLLGLTGNRLHIGGRGDIVPMPSLVPTRGSGAAVGEPETTQALPPDATPVQRTLYSTIANSIVTSLAATAGQAALESIRAAEMATRPGGTGTPVRDAAIAGAMPSQRTLSMFGVSNMWGVSQRVSTQNQDGLDLSQARTQLQRIETEYESNVTNQGWAGSRTSGRPDINLAQNTGVRDPYMADLMGRAVELGRSLANSDMRVLSTLRDEQAGITGSPSYNPRERAEQRANIDRRIMEQQRETVQKIRAFEQEQSAYWGRRIRLSDIQRGTAMADLPQLTPQ